MSSVTRFIKQVTPGLNIIAPPALSALYEFVPNSSNYVGNYTPGAMVQASNSPTLLAYLTVAGGPYATGTLVPGVIARDMGKTIKASVATTEADAIAGIVVVSSEQHWRMIQLLRPKAGNTDGASGVQGGPTIPNGYSDYVTVYIPVTVVGTGSVVSVATVLVGGQM